LAVAVSRLSMNSFWPGCVSLRPRAACAAGLVISVISSRSPKKPRAAASPPLPGLGVAVAEAAATTASDPPMAWCQEHGDVREAVAELRQLQLQRVHCSLLHIDTCIMRIFTPCQAATYLTLSMPFHADKHRIAELCERELRGHDLYKDLLPS
jgi:hypothetical protein